jgi:hypothetical protein
MRGDCKEWEPSTFPSAAWWTKVLRNSLADVLDNLHGGRQPRAIVLDEGCSGMGSAHIVCKGLGAKVGGGICSDMKESARKVQLLNLRGDIDHIFGTMREHALGHGHCFKHGRQVTVNYGVGDDSSGAKPCDVMVVGPPCQPFSSQRGNRKSVNAAQHVLYESTFEVGGVDSKGSAIELVRARLPGVLVLEQVVGFCKKDKNGQNPAEVFVRHLKEIKVNGEPFFTGFHIFSMSPEAWLCISRPRTLHTQRHTHTPFFVGRFIGHSCVHQLPGREI